MKKINDTKIKDNNMVHSTSVGVLDDTFECKLNVLSDNVENTSSINVLNNRVLASSVGISAQASIPDSSASVLNNAPLKDLSQKMPIKDDSENINLTNKKVAVGLSGGVDSSVSAYLLKKQGYDVTGVYMQCWDSKYDGCTADEDKKYAVETASKLNIKIVSLDYINQYKQKVISYFYDEYKNGRTPNPDVMCNKEIKFGMFYNWAMKNGFDYVATGHYARVKKIDNKFNLLKGVDESKDQSYFLYTLNQDQLSKILFPVGDMYKKQIRKIAKDNNLPSANKPDSMGICFIGEVDIKDFLSKKIDKKVGDVVLSDGTKIGTHEGAWFYTIGQRRGFTISKYQGNPLYVINKDVNNNTLTVGTKEKLYKDSFKIQEIHFIDGIKKDNFKCTVRIRHLGDLYKANVNNNIVHLDQSVFGIAPGQSVVFYNNDVVIGGAVIK